MHVGGVPAGIVLSLQAGFSLSVHTGIEPSEHLAGGAGLVPVVEPPDAGLVVVVDEPPDAGLTGSAAEEMETNKQMTAIEVFLII